MGQTGTPISETGIDPEETGRVYHGATSLSGRSSDCTKTVMRVLGRRVLVKREPMSDRHGLLWLPDRAKQRPQGGIVMSVGDLVTTLKPGDHILFGRYAGIETHLAGVDYVVLWETDVMAVLDGGSEHLTEC